MKLKNLIDRLAFEAFIKSGEAAGFTDSSTGVVLARNLTHVDPRIFEKKFPELAFMNAGFEINNEGGFAARIQSLRLIEEGTFRDAADLSGNKGKISLKGEDSDILVTERTAESEWSDTDVKQAELGNINLPSRYVATHNKIYQREIDQIGLLGKGKATPGVLNYSGFGSDAAAGFIDTLSAQEMYDEFAALIDDQKNAVNNTPEYTADTVITPIRVINALQRTMLNTANGFATVLAALQTNFSVKFMGSFRADRSTDVATDSKTAAISTNSESMLMRIPLPLQIGSIEKLGSFTFHVDSKYRIAGMDFLDDTGGRILTGL